MKEQLPILSFPPVLENHQSIFYFYEFDCSKYLIYMDSVFIFVVTGLFHLL